MPHFSFLTLIFFLFSCVINLSHALNNGFSVELIHRDSFKSPIYNPSETNLQRIVNSVRRSTHRANYFKKERSLQKNKPTSTVIADKNSLEYFISYSVGTPAFKVYGMLDTGSDLIWFQCKPCRRCLNHTSHLYDPSKSSSYKNIHCSSKTCKSSPGVQTSCSHDEDVCKYTASYGSGMSKGDLITETLTFDSTSNSSVSFPKIVMGCGHLNVPLGSEHIPGIVGLGNTPLSIAKQLGSSIGGKFSYCLISPFSSQSNSSSKLNFGDAAVVSGEGVVSTPFAKSQLGYFLTLEAFSVGNKRIEYGGFYVKGVNVSTRSIVIDSGTNGIILPQKVYTSLESAVAEVVTLERFEDPTHQFSLCYNTTSKQSNLPIITAHFSGANIKLSSDRTFAPLVDGVVCFYAVPNPSVGIFGNIAQHNLLVGYDLEKNIVSFKPTDCTKQ